MTDFVHPHISAPWIKFIQGWLGFPHTPRDNTSPAKFNPAKAHFGGQDYIWALPSKTASLGFVKFRDLSAGAGQSISLGSPLLQDIRTILKPGHTSLWEENFNDVDGTTALDPGNVQAYTYIGHPNERI